MDTSALGIFFLFLFSVVRIPEVSSTNNKIKIIVPHKISVIHHHHSKITDLKPRKKSRFDIHDILKSNQVHHQEEEEEEEEEGSEEDVSGEGRFGHYLDEHEDADSSRRAIAYYTIPATKYSHPVRVYMKPVFLYNDSNERKRPPRYEYYRQEDYDYPEETYQESKYYVRGF